MDFFFFFFIKIFYSLLSPVQFTHGNRENNNNKKGKTLVQKENRTKQK